MPVADGEIYKRTRIGLGMSRADLSALAKRAGHRVSTGAITRLEEKGRAAANGRSITAGALSWLEYVLGITPADDVVTWSSVEQGAPCIVHGERGVFQFLSLADDGSISVFGGERNRERFRAFPAERVRLVATTTLPPVGLARVFETRHKAPASVYAEKIMAHIHANPGAHSVGALAYTLDMPNGLVSRVTADLSRRGELDKVGRGVYVVATPDLPVEAGPPEPPPEAAKAALAERVGADRPRRFDF